MDDEQFLHSAWLKRPLPHANGALDRIPLSIYVLWHPKNRHGPALGRALYDWLSWAQGDMRRAGLGIPIHFRSDRWTPQIRLDASPAASGPQPASPQEARSREVEDLRRPIQLDEADINVLVPLVDEHMVCDPSWRRDLIEAVKAEKALGAHSVGSGGPRVLLLGVQLSEASNNLPSVFTRLQSIRLDRWADQQGVDPEIREARWAERLPPLFTQSLVGLIEENRVLTRVFLSHAKADGARGPGIAEELRDIATRHGQLQVFYDENSLKAGAGWVEPIEEAARTSGFVAVLSEQYARRYWCRREVEIARTPREQVRDGSPGTTGHVWFVQPTVAVSALGDQWSRFVPDLGSCPVVAWDPAQAQGVLDRLLLEALIGEFHRRIAWKLVDALDGLTPVQRSAIGVPSDTQVHILTWSPDSTSVLRLMGAMGSKSNPALFVYPGHGLLPVEEQSMRAGLEARGVELVSFEGFRNRIRRAQVTQPAEVPPRPLDMHPRLALSAGNSPELGALGYDTAGGRSRHLDDVMIRLIRGAFAADLRLVYGGVLRDGPNFTEVFLETVAAHVLATTEGGSEDVHPTTPLTCLQAWPFHHHLTTQIEARQHGICTFVPVAPPGWSPSQMVRRASDLPPDTAGWATATALSRMRCQMAGQSDAALLTSGRTHGWAGAMPGVAEELLCHCEAALPIAPKDLEVVCPLGAEELRARIRALESMRPEDVSVVMIGEYGGIVRQMVRAILGPAPPPEDDSQLSADPTWRLFTLTHHLQHPENGPLRTALDGTTAADRSWIVQRYRLLRAALRGLHAVAQRPEEELERLGLSIEAWTDLMRIGSPGHLRTTIRRRIGPALHDDRASPKGHHRRRDLPQGVEVM